MDSIPHINKTSSSKLFKNSKKKQNYPSNNHILNEKRKSKIKVQVSGYDSKGSQFSVPFQKSTPFSEVKLIIHQQLRKLRVNIETIIGFQSEIGNFALDYKLEVGIGYLDKEIKLKCFHFESQKGLEKYKICCCLAIGGFSKVFLVRSKETGKFHAAKFMDKSKQGTNKQLIQNEKQVSLQLNSPFLVKTYEFHQTEEFYVFIMEYCPGGQLFYMLKHIKYMSEDQARLCFIQVLLGIQYLHNLGYMYRDMKPENVLLDCYGFLKIADFGLAKPHSQKSYSFCGSVQYMAPEVLRGKGHGKLVDFYCLGALLYEMLIGHPPFYQNNVPSEYTKQKILNNQIQFPKEGISPLAKDLIIKLTHKNQKQRLGYFGGCRQIMAHPWVGKINRKIFEQKKFNPPFPVNLDRLNFDPEEIGQSERMFEQRINFAISAKVKNQSSTQNFKKVDLIRKKKSLSQRLASRKSKSPYRYKSFVNSSCEKKTKSPYQYILKKGKSGKTVKTEQNQELGSGWISKKFIKDLRWTEKSQETCSKLKKKCMLVPFLREMKTQNSVNKNEKGRKEFKKKQAFPSFSDYLF